ncbi:MFS transporter [Sphingorhabdus pulchriflava]|uniref:MFS transporter n=1 Tax=Sphingorhabdus pulchriflava TaxID=2292257 RepID=A0A371BFX1_9SPHN|nr:MFS transporter [Sphingorhabdus pulchriflava]RDV06303.1 MFS transporter [Sphingorhabdus pulchriflava]
MTSTTRAWYTVALLCAMAVMSYLDRYIIALLADPIIAEFAITTTDVGLLIGLGFGLVYAIAGVPLAHWLDQGQRVRIVAFGVALWSLCTASSGIAPDYPTLLASRVGVAIGEAVLVPATISLIGDLFEPHRRTLPIAVFMGTASLMGSGAFIIGGLAYQFANVLAPDLEMEAWRLTMIMVGIPGLILAPLLLLSVAEPARTVAHQAETEDSSIRAVANHLSAHLRYYLPFFMALGISAIGTFSLISWSSAMLSRSYNMPLAAAGSLYGTAGLLAGILAAIFWPAASAWAQRKHKAYLNMLFMAAGLGAAQLSMALIPWAGSQAVALGSIAVAIFGIAASGTLAVIILQSAAPPLMRARITSLYVLTGNLIGLTVGPPLSAWISENLYSGQDAMRSTFGLLGMVLLPTVFILLLIATSGYRKCLEETV